MIRNLFQITEKGVHENMKKQAFTLAEVLMTLGIIGVVAAMTLPTLIIDFQKRSTATMVKTLYSKIN